MSEFVSPNKIGGYASFDLVDGYTRKYHGLLVAGYQNFIRRVLVAGAKEYLYIGDQKYDFSGVSYLEQKEPASKKYLQKSFYLPFPTQIFKIGNVEIIKQVIYSEQKNEVVLSYEFKSPSKFRFQFEPLFACRKTDEIGLQFPLSELYIQDHSYKQLVRLPEENELEIWTSLLYRHNPVLSHEHYYALEEKRGYEAVEDLIIAGAWESEFASGHHKVEIRIERQEKFKIRKVFSAVDAVLNPSDNTSVASDVGRFKQVHTNIDDDFTEFLVYNARQFMVRDDLRYSLLAGYHWFEDWSRDTFISFKGTFLALGRFFEARRVLLDWSKFIVDGLLPNRMYGTSYNSIDGVLWYFVAIWYYWQSTTDRDTIKQLLPKLERVVTALINGSKYGIGINDRGYLIWTDSNEALTWMDAKVDGVVATDRTGACIEIQALWYNALQILEKLAMLTDYSLVNPVLIDELEELLEKNLVTDFWLEDRGYFADLIRNDGNVVEKFRPNQLALYALPFRLGDIDKGKRMLSQVKADLLTPLGLRTLTPFDPDYCENYDGDQASRDKIYHQGIVWVWPLMLYYLSVLKLDHKSESAIAEVRDHMLIGWEEIKQRELLHIPEIYSGRELKPAGSVSQAWSVAAYLEVLMVFSEFF